MLKNLMSGLVGVAAILAIYWLAQFRQPSADKGEGPFELPHATLVIDGLDLGVAANRANAARFERELAEEKTVAFSGLSLRYQPAWGTGTPPGGAPETLRQTMVLLPGKNKGDQPIAKPLATLTDEEYAIASRYFRSGDFIIPRLMAPDGAGYVLRIAPKDPRRRAFEPEAVASIKGRAARFAGAGFKPSLYSRSMGLGGAPERNLTNAVFGVQTTWVRVTMAENSFFQVANLKVLEEERTRTVQKEGANIRSYTTPGSWVRYYTAVRFHHTGGDLELPGDAALPEIFEFARREGFHPLVTADGALALIDVTTDLEGEDLERLTFRLAQPLGAVPNTKVFFYTRKGH